MFSNRFNKHFNVKNLWNWNSFVLILLIKKIVFCIAIENNHVEPLLNTVFLCYQSRKIKIIHHLVLTYIVTLKLIFVTCNIKTSIVIPGHRQWNPNHPLILLYFVRWMRVSETHKRRMVWVFNWQCIYIPSGCRCLWTDACTSQ